MIYRFDAPLFFANAKTFRDEIRRLARADPPPAWIIIAAVPVTDIDTTASDVLEDLDDALNAQGISLVFAERKDPVRGKIERYGLARTIEPRHLFPTVGTAVAAFRAQTGAQWTPAPQVSADGAPPGQGVAGDTAPPDGVSGLGLLHVVVQLELVRVLEASHVGRRNVLCTAETYS